MLPRVDESGPWRPALLTAGTRWRGACVASAAVAFQALWLGWPAVLLSVAMLIALAVWLAAEWQVESRLRGLFALATVVFLVHAGEEFMAGFHREVPALLGRAAWSDARFLVFNAVWAMVFVVAAARLGPRRPLPILVVLFFAIAGGVGNGVVHLLLVARQGGYFPGAWTAPLCLLIGVGLLRSLFGAGRRGSFAS